MKTIAALGCTALAAALMAYGCGSSSTIDNGAGGGSSGTGGKPAGGTGGGVVVIVATGGMTGTAGMNGTAGTNGGMGGMVQPPQDAGPPMCAPNNMCTAPFMCEGTMCRVNGMNNGTRTCTCGMNGRLACTPCVGPDAGAPPPPVDAGPRPDAGVMCAGNVNNGRVCMVGVSPSPCARIAGGGGMQTCTCAVAPGQDAGAGPDAAAPIARYTCM
jgi:hypothetical protein